MNRFHVILNINTNIDYFNHYKELTYLVGTMISFNLVVVIVHSLAVSKIA